MPIDYAIDSSRDTVVTRMHGRIGAPELVEFVRAARQDPTLQACRKSLVDLSGVTGVDVDPDLIVDFALARPVRQGRRVAVVAPHDVGFGLARIFSGFATTPDCDEVQVFRNHASALAWLDEAG